MTKRPIFPLLLLLAATVAIYAQDGPPQDGPGGERGGFVGGARGVRGTVTAVSGTTVTIKTDEGDVYKVFTSENTRIMKQPMQAGGNREPDAGERQPLKVNEIHVGDTLMAGGQLDAKAKTVGAVFVAVIDAEQAKKMRENLGKTWTAGDVTAIKDATITIKRMDNVEQTFNVDENTSFKKRRDSITMADIQVGDRLTAQGALKDGAFLATTVNIGRAGGPGGEGRGQGMGSGAGSSSTAAPKQ
jgi:preprotein translocase subunit YajC